MPEITMPRLSDTMEDGVVSAWLKQVGDPVARGEVLAEIETDKALMELEAYDDGVLELIIAEPGTRVPIGEAIAIVGDGSGSQQPSAPKAAPAPAAEPEKPAPAVESAPAVTETDGRRPKSSPLARRVAAELGVDLQAVTGTGPGGRITRQDVDRAAEKAPAARKDEQAAAARKDEQAAETTANTAKTESRTPAGDYDEIPLTTIQQVSAKRLTESKQQAPHIYLTIAIDVTDLLAFRGQLNETLAAAGKSKVSVNDLLVKAAATTLRTDPAVNVSVADGKLLRHHGIHLGVAVATPAGLLVPVIRDADRKSVSEIAAESRDKAERARERKLRGDEMSGGTFTLSNLGMFGIEQFTAVINPPESAILAIGAAQDELRLLDDGAVIARKILRVTLSADHRAIDGAVAARFLQQFKDLLESPLRIVA
ncbi:dihydrolipoamide acetyltransferase family protein [Nocardia pseudobrasiliensis]|uniref:Dihydrolipoamide acetyltransferase component of pyruvate dehydrogenase complex n=1 Tax=Nocardia pseudobrasiliensis TaxID=45979 RepID=A0A370I0K2_9NOCA|nr:dihydrolipoamide acetyltransferase family protein [Nocardia pseudobrasiliensis]RDI64090.1 pyruvate dehydrogenase E2 component (dihydrolipoamide acetyltransferase) [Nocardia pseudobrasiliensis]